MSALLTLLLAVLLVFPFPEARLQRYTNQSRHDHGLPALVRGPRLSDMAERHTHRMIHSGGLFHSNGPAWCSGWAENVGLTGGSLLDLHRAFMASPLHRANILGAYTRVGIGIARQHGVWWATVIFCR